MHCVYVFVKQWATNNARISYNDKKINKKNNRQLQKQGSSNFMTMKHFSCEDEDGQTKKTDNAQVAQK